MSTGKKIDHGLCRRETLARMPAFVGALKTTPPWVLFRTGMIFGHQICLTVYATVKHTDGRRSVECSPDGAMVAKLTDDEKNAIAVMVQDAAVGCGMRVWYKHSESTPSRLVYRVGYENRGQS